MKFLKRLFIDISGALIKRHFLYVNTAFIP